MIFPKGFVWGTATASYQIEGAAKEDGRGESIWDRFSHTPGKVVNGDTGDVACDHYHRYEADLDLMAALGFHSYRLSTAWPRIVPDGDGAINAAGLDFYDRLIDAVLARGIRPFVTLYHWDLPQALEDKGGWTWPGVVDAFVRYTDLITRRLGDRVKDWITLNEPWCSASLGYGRGIHAPGDTSFTREIHAAHYLLRAHGLAVPVVRQNAPGAQVGITLNVAPQLPVNDDPANVAAAAAADALYNRWYLEPVFYGRYPQAALDMPRVQTALQGLDVSAIADAAAPTDFLGLNYYFHGTIEADGAGGGQGVSTPGIERTAMGWEVSAPYLTYWLHHLWTMYQPKAIYITENGAAFPDEVVNGKIEDTSRVRFLRDYITAVHAASLLGVPMAGYFAWSFMDNFEWGEGYARRFGIVYTDYATQTRTPKASAYYLRDLIHFQNGDPTPA